MFCCPLVPLSSPQKPRLCVSFSILKVIAGTHIVPIPRLPDRVTPPLRSLERSLAGLLFHVCTENEVKMRYDAYSEYDHKSDRSQVVAATYRNLSIVKAKTAWSRV